MTKDEIRSILQSEGLCGESNGHQACLLALNHAGRHGYESEREAMTVDEAKAWIDQWMSAGGSYSDAQSLATLVNKTRADALREALDAGEQAAMEILSSKGFIGTPTQAKWTRDNMHSGVLKVLEKLRAL